MNREEAAQELLGRGWSEVEAERARYVEAADARVARTEFVAFTETLPELPRTHMADEAVPRIVSGDSLDGVVGVGYDADERVVIARYYHGGAATIEAVWVGDVLLRFAHDLTLVHATLDPAGRPTELRWWFDGSRARRHRYMWDGDRLSHTVIDDFHEDRLSDRVRSDYDYDEQGLLRVRWAGEYHRPLIAESWMDGGVAWFRRSPKALKAARALVATELPKRVAAWVSRVAPTEPVFGLGLMYSIDDPALPPALGLGTAAELRGWKGQPDLIFNPAEYRMFDPQPAEFADLLDAFTLLNQDWELGENEHEPQRTLRRCARDLLPHIALLVTPTEDFCVFVVADEHDDDFPRQLRATVPAAILRRLSRP